MTRFLHTIRCIQAYDFSMEIAIDVYPKLSEPNHNNSDARHVSCPLEKSCAELDVSPAGRTRCRQETICLHGSVIIF